MITKSWPTYILPVYTWDVSTFQRLVDFVHFYWEHHVVWHGFHPGVESLLDISENLFSFVNGKITDSRFSKTVFNMILRSRGPREFRRKKLDTYI